MLCTLNCTLSDCCASDKDDHALSSSHPAWKQALQILGHSHTLAQSVMFHLVLLGQEGEVFDF